MAQKLFTVTVYDKWGDKERYTFAAKDDVTARAKAVAKHVSQAKQSMARIRAADERNGELSKDKNAYRFDESDIDYCEVKFDGTLD